MPSPAGHSKPFARASLALIGLAWSVPFLQPYHRFPLTSFYSEWLAFALALAAALPLAAKQPWREAEVPAIALLPPALILLLGAQVALGRVPYFEQALAAAGYLLWASLLMLLARFHLRELGWPALAATLAAFLLAGGVLGAAAGLLQHYAPFPLPGWLVARKVSGAVYGNLGQANHYAAYLALALGSLAYLYGTGRVRAAGATAAAAVLLPALALSGSRGAWLYLALLPILALLALRAAPAADARPLRRITLCLLPGFVAAQWLVSLTSGFAAAPGGQVTSVQRLFEVANGIAPRLQLAREAWDLFLTAPVLGAGLGQFAGHHFLHVAATGDAAAAGLYHHAHNLMLHLMAETGAAGALLVAGGLLLWLADLRGGRSGPESWWMLALLGVIGTHSLLEYPLWYAYFLGIAAVLLGAGARRVLRPQLAGSARAAVVLLMVLGWMNLATVWASYRDFERLVFLPRAAGDAAPAGDGAYAEAIARLHREPWLLPYVELAVAFGVTVAPEDLAAKRALVERAARFAPVSVIAYRHAQLLALAGEGAAARDQLRRAARVYPGELADAIAALDVLAARHPAEMAPLLKLALAIQVEQRAARATK